MRVLVDLLYLALAPFGLAYLLVASRGFTLPKFRRGLLSKFGRTPRREGSEPSFWVHAVSVGEVLTAQPLVEALRRAYPGWDVRVSVSTYTGFEVARKRLPDAVVFYFPADLSFVVRRFFRRHRPTCVILLELEVWPNFLLAAAREGVPVLVANGRVTERSARRYALAGPLARRFLNLVSSYGVQNETYRERFLRLGVEPGRVEVLGNLKHDREPAPAAARAPATRAALGWDFEGSAVLVAGSTHPGEEAAISALYERLASRHPNLRLVVAPRHVERLVSGEIERWGCARSFRRWSEFRDRLGGLTGGLGESVLVVDTLGELELFYALGDVVFVGGSLVPHGGHNLFEAARLGKPVVFGPSYQNFQEEGDALIAEGAAVRVEDERGLEAALERLLSSREERERLGRAARAVTDRLKGATARHIAWIERRLRGRVS